MKPAASALLIVLVVLAVPAAAGGVPQPLAADGERAPGPADRQDEPIALQDESLGLQNESLGLQNEPIALQEEPIDVEGTTNKLSLPDGSNGSYARPVPDLGSTLAGQHEAIRTDYHLFAVENLSAELDEDERREAIESAVVRIEDRMAELTSREREVVEAHADGEAESEDVLRTLARNYEEALELQQALDRLSARSNEVSGASVPAQSYTAELEVHVSPIRQQLSSTLRDGSGGTSPALLETSPDGYVLSTVENGEYVREITRYDNRDPGQSNQFDDLGDASDTAEALYPWAWENSRSKSVIAHGSSGLYNVQVPHAQGDLTLYLDHGTGATYNELQVIEADQLPIVAERSHEGANLSVTVSRTAAPGPALVAVADAETNESVDATVAVDGAVLGETGAGGEAWIVPPKGDFELAVDAGDRTTTANVSVAE